MLNFNHYLERDRRIAVAGYEELQSIWLQLQEEDRFLGRDVRFRGGEIQFPCTELPIATQYKWVKRQIAACALRLAEGTGGGKEESPSLRTTLRLSVDALTGHISEEDFNFLMSWYKLTETAARTINYHCKVVGDYRPNLKKISEFFSFVEKDPSRIEKLTTCNVYGAELRKFQYAIYASRAQGWRLPIDGFVKPIFFAALVAFESRDPTQQEVKAAMRYYKGEDENPFETRNQAPNPHFLWEREAFIAHMDENMFQRDLEGFRSLDPREAVAQYFELDPATRYIVYHIGVAADTGYWEGNRILPFYI